MKPHMITTVTAESVNMKMGRRLSHAAAVQFDRRRSPDSPQQNAEPLSNSERELIAAAQSAVSSALEELLMRHHMIVYRTARRLSRNAQEAEDLTKETMLRSLKNIGIFRRKPSSPPGWWRSLPMRRSRSRGRRTACAVRR